MAETKTAQTSNSALPEFEAGTRYRVKMAHAVQYPPNSGNWLRPDQVIDMDGALATQMKDAILAAELSPT